MTQDDALGALNHAYYALYAVLVRDGLVTRGELPDLLKSPGVLGFVESGVQQAIIEIANQLDRIDAGPAANLRLVPKDQDDDPR